jgi:UDP-N-acetylmuramate dehydrogenase
VLALRGKKGMLYNETPQNWSAGSFFVNPIISKWQAGELPQEAPRWPQIDGQVKIPAAWLLENAGVAKGETLGGAKISDRHVLAIVNAGTATTQEIVSLARSARERVQAKFGITLTAEVRFVGVEL